MMETKTNCQHHRGPVAPIPIGNTVCVRWEVLTNGEALPLAGRDITVVLTTPRGLLRRMDHSVRDGNVVCFTLEGKDQSWPGTYRVDVYENRGRLSQARLDTDAFELVPRSWMGSEPYDTSDGLETVITVELGPGNLITGGRDGKSAYEVAVDAGFEGTVEEWLASLVGPKGNTGVTPEIGITATVDAQSKEVPTVTVTKGGTKEQPTFGLAFSGLKGSPAPLPYGETTSGSFVSAMATVPGITRLEDGVACMVYNQHLSGAANSFSLNVNGYGSLDLYDGRGQNIKALGTGWHLLLVYSSKVGSFGGWLCNEMHDSTYGVMTASELRTGTGTTGKLLTAAVLRECYRIEGGTVTIGGESITPLTSHQDISGKEDRTAVVAALNEEDETLAVTALAAEAGRYYRLDVAVGTLAVTLPAMTDTSVVRTVVLFLTAGTAPAVTFTAADGRAVYYADGFEIEAGGTYEVNALFNGAAWVIACVTIITE